MLDKDFIICKTRTELSEFIQPMTEQLDRPRKKFLRQVIGAILLSGSLVVTEITHWIRDDCSDCFYQLKRLLNHLVSFKGDLSEAVSSYRRFMSRYIQQDTPILIDITDIAKPRGKKDEISGDGQGRQRRPLSSLHNPPAADKSVSPRLRRASVKKYYHTLAYSLTGSSIFSCPTLL